MGRPVSEVQRREEIREAKQTRLGSERLETRDGAPDINRAPMLEPDRREVEDDDPRDLGDDERIGAGGGDVGLEGEVHGPAGRMPGGDGAHGCDGGGGGR